MAGLTAGALPAHSQRTRSGLRFRAVNIQSIYMPMARSTFPALYSGRRSCVPRSCDEIHRQRRRNLTAKLSMAVPPKVTASQGICQHTTTHTSTHTPTVSVVWHLVPTHHKILPDTPLMQPCASKKQWDTDNTRQKGSRDKMFSRTATFLTLAKTTLSKPNHRAH